MVLEELAARLNDGRYKNWLKAGQCLRILRNGLHPLVSQQMRAFHSDLLNQNRLLHQQCQSLCAPRGTKFPPLCRWCSEWQAEILKHHTQRDTATVNWCNCVPHRWRTDYWEVAKAYMPRGQKEVRQADQCDASALLNLINYCDWFRCVDLRCVKEVIRYRNELMHSCDWCVEDAWLMRYRTSLKNLIRQFSHVSEMVKVGQEIDEMLSVDLSIYISGLDNMDSGTLVGLETDSFHELEISGSLISQWEDELLHDLVLELLHGATHDEDAKTQDTEQLKRLGGFLQANRDLGEKFSAELQTISSLEARD